MKSTQDYITEIDFQVKDLKEKKRNGYYGFSLEMTKQTANEIKAYFEKENCQVEIRECPRKLWDLVVTW